VVRSTHVKGLLVSVNNQINKHSILLSVIIIYCVITLYFDA